MAAWHAAAMSKRDMGGLLVAVGVLATMLLYRAVWVEPREWGAICLAAEAPFACAPRAALLWLQHWQLWGGGALALGLWAFLFPRAPFAVRVAAVALGAVAVVNYNATWGVVAAALGAWVWVMERPAPRAG